MLYRAATRSFHSTRILRHLFTVHAALAEFNLASKALDSYFEILTKGKARVEKSGEADPGLDDDGTAMFTAATGITTFCRHGRRKDVERSLGIASIIGQWLHKHHQTSSAKTTVSADDVPNDLLDQTKERKSSMPRMILAFAYHALGVSQSCWARTTYETSSRSNLQAKAISNFNTALEPQFGEEDNVMILHSLAFVLAETRDLDAAVIAIKRALSAKPSGRQNTRISRADFATDSVEEKPSVDIENRGLLLRCWHLLALLLSARHDFSNAIASCEAALDLYGSKTILYGETQSLGTDKSLSASESKYIVELKMTQLALAEVMDGPEEAVNASGELLGLYAKLFNYTDKSAPKGLEEKRKASPPTSTNGIARSFRGSILGIPSSSLKSSEPSDETGRAPNIAAATNDGVVSQKSHLHSRVLGRRESNKLRKQSSRKSISSVKERRATSPSKLPSSDGSHHNHLNLTLPSRHRHNEPAATDESRGGASFLGSSYASDEVGVAISHDLPSIPSTPATASHQTDPLQNIQSATQNMNHKNPNTIPVPPKPPPDQRTPPPQHC